MGVVMGVPVLPGQRRGDAHGAVAEGVCVSTPLPPVLFPPATAPLPLSSSGAAPPSLPQPPPLLSHTLSLKARPELAAAAAQQGLGLHPGLPLRQASQVQRADQVSPRRLQPPQQTAPQQQQQQQQSKPDAEPEAAGAAAPASGEGASSASAAYEFHELVVPGRVYMIERRGADATATFRLLRDVSRTQLGRMLLKRSMLRDHLLGHYIAALERVTQQQQQQQH
ncbi:hypothetical protein Agub_g12692 [Astrephomene gubernaculifera]|uniref:Uncharacterized protein n=1 Tax=Astrephomene gubernaculifera TaxID=47775 RepID=A0AAD3DYZ2_9CHLO|nr:hypothetical protein Agub_g12692 [Astrephomene gubernaculifera]